MLTRKDAQTIVENALIDASKVAGVSFYAHYSPNSGPGKRIYLMPTHKGKPSQRETFGGKRHLVVDYEFDVGILVDVESDKVQAIEKAESDVDAILTIVIEKLLERSEISIGEEEFYVGKAEINRSAAAANINVKVRDIYA